MGDYRLDEKGEPQRRSTRRRRLVSPVVGFAPTCQKAVDKPLALPHFKALVALVSTFPKLRLGSRVYPAPMGWTVWTIYFVATRRRTANARRGEIS